MSLKVSLFYIVVLLVETNCIDWIRFILVDIRTQNYAVYHVPIISCICVYLAYKGVYECWCRIRVRGFWGGFRACS